MNMDIVITTAVCPGLALAAGLVRADLAVRSADGPGGQQGRPRGHRGDRRVLRPLVGIGPVAIRVVDARRHAARRRLGRLVRVGRFGSLRLTIGYYIDSLTVAMFCMVTLVASCIHFYSIGYMHGELYDVIDAAAPLADGQPMRRRGRYYRFFQYLSLFCFSMLGLVVAGNVAMVFMFWELVGICSYLLIGFWHERRAPATRPTRRLSSTASATSA